MYQVRTLSDEALIWTKAVARESLQIYFVFENSRALRTETSDSILGEFYISFKFMFDHFHSWMGQSKNFPGIFLAAYIFVSRKCKLMRGLWVFLRRCFVDDKTIAATAQLWEDECSRIILQRRVSCSASFKFSETIYELWKFRWKF